MGTAKEWQVFILGLLWGGLITQVLPILIKDMVNLFGELFKLVGNRFLSFFKITRNYWSKCRKTKKSPVVGATEQSKKNMSKYSISNSCTDFHSQDLERWS